MAVPGIPQNVTITSNAIDGDTVSWDAVANATSYNLYWKENKAPNYYFEDLDEWTITKFLGTEIAIIDNSSQLYMEVFGGDSLVTLSYDYEVQSGDYEVIVDIIDYNSVGNGPGLDLILTSSDGNDFLRYFYYYASGQHRMRTLGAFGDNPPFGLIPGWYHTTPTLPTKMRIGRSGTIMYIGCYVNGAWGYYYQKEYSSWATNLKNIEIRLRVSAGDATVDNLIITPSVYSYGNVITGITDTEYSVNLDDGFYCYEVTAVNDDGESATSEEVNGTLVFEAVYKASEINALYLAKEIDSLYTFQEIDELYSPINLASLYTSEDIGLLSAREITNLHSTILLPEA
jgi:hypothetical protein